MRKVAKISKVFCEGITTPLFIYNRHSDCVMFTGDNCDEVLDKVLAYAKLDGCTHYSPDRANDFRSYDEQKAADDMGYAWEPVLKLY